MAGRERNVRLFPFHDQVARIALDRMEPAQKRRIHRRLATQIASVRPNAFHALADHWRLAGVPERASAYALRAAEHAEDVQLMDRAVRYYAMALGFPPAGREDWQIRERLATVLDRSGRFSEAGRAFRDAARQAPKSVRSGLMLRGARALLKAAETPTAFRTMESVTRLLWDEPLMLPRWRIVAGIILEYLGSRPWFPARLLPLKETSLDSTELCIELALVTRAMMPLRATHLTARALRLARRQGDPVAIARVLVAVAGTLGSLGSPAILERSRALLGAAEALFGGDPNVAGLGNLHAVRSLLGSLSCRWDDMRASRVRAIEAFLAEGNPQSWHAQMVRVQGVIGEVDAGNLQGAEELSQELLAPDSTWTDDGVSGWVLWARVRVELAFQRWHVADRLCRQGLEGIQGVSDASRPLWLRFRTGLGVALAGLERERTAVTCIQRTVMTARRSIWMDPLGRSEMHFNAATVFVAAATRTTGRARRRHLRQARQHATRLRRSSYRFLRPRGTRLMAEVQLLRGRHRSALRLARRAVDELLATQQRLEAAQALHVQARIEEALSLPQGDETRRTASAQLAEILSRRSR